MLLLFIGLKLLVQKYNFDSQFFRSYDLHVICLTTDYSLGFCLFTAKITNLYYACGIHAEALCTDQQIGSASYLPQGNGKAKQQPWVK